MTLESLIRKNREEMLSIAKKNGAQQIRLFGSASRGQSAETSDIDLLVTMKPGSTLFQIIAIKQDLEDLLGRKVDVVTESSLSPYIREDILKEAVNL